MNSACRKITKEKITVMHILDNLNNAKYKRNLIASSTYNRRLATANIIRQSSFAHIPIQRVTDVELQSFVDTLVKYANSYIDKIFEMLESAFREAVKRRYVQKDPMLFVERPRSNKQTRIVRAFTLEEQKAFLLALSTEPLMYQNIFSIAIHTGMRMGEILALTSYDISDGFIHVRRTLSRDVNDKTVIGLKTKTYSGVRYIPIIKPLEKYINSALRHASNNYKHLLFTHPDKSLISVSTMNIIFKRICRKAHLGEECFYKNNKGVQRVSSYNQHMLRHTYATRCIEAKITPDVLQVLLGHKDIQTTINTYVTVFNKYKESEIEKYSDYISRCM